MNFSYIVIDDEKLHVTDLQDSLEPHSEFVCKGSAGTLSQATALILQEKPSLIFLSAELDGESGFDLFPVIREFFTELPSVIILSYSEKYARQAINNDVCYFLDKPVNTTQLTLALAKFKRYYSEKNRYLTIKDKSGHWFIQHSNILYIQADSNYSYIHRINNKRITVTKTLKDIETILPASFLRVHKSYIVNVSYIEKVNTTLRSILLNVKTGFFDFADAREGRGIDHFQPKEISMDIPIGEMYLEKVKNSLLTAKSS